VAATLMRIKAKMLLPRPALDDEGNEVDPREELVRHLLEYKKYKSVVQELSAMEEGRLQKETRGNVAQELKTLAEVSDVESELQGLDLYKLLRVYGRVMQKFNLEQEKPLHSVVQFPFTIAGQKEYILQLMTENTKVSFEDIIALIPHRIGVIFNFLAILELLQLRLISLTLGLGFNNFWIERYEEELVA
jgi:segregation and condensation protein A